MSDIKITQADVDERFEAGHYDVVCIGNNVIVNWCIEGWNITANSACVDPANFSKEIGIELCIEKIKSEIWKLMGYELFLLHKGIMKRI